MQEGKQQNSTSEHFRHGSDLPITRKNIAAVQKRRKESGKAPWGPSGVVVELVSNPEPRHVKRAMQLMEGKKK